MKQAEEPMKVCVNGAWLEARPGESVLDLARANNVRIPTLCHHRRLSASGACRLCLVEVEREGGNELSSACTLQVSEGLMVVTDSPRLRESRARTISLLLSRAPESPLLLKLAEEIGVEMAPQPAMTDARALPECVLCGLCVRACNATGVEALAFEGRGRELRVVRPLDDEENSACTECHACWRVCPTSAIRGLFGGLE